MRAVLVEKFGSVADLTVGTIESASPGPGQVLIDVVAASVNFPDILVVEGTYQHLPALPFPPGKEAAGRVAAVGAGVTRVAVGQRVLALTEYGAYAEQLCVDEHSVFPLPSEVSYHEAAALGLAASTAHLGLVRRGGLRAGETVLVTGAGGGVGTAAVQIAKAQGGRVIALAENAEKAELVSRLGADVVLTSAPRELRDDVFAVTDGRGVDLVLEMLGGDFLTEIIRATAWEGRIVIVGFASGSQNPVKPGHLLVKNIALSGLQSSDYRDRRPEVLHHAVAATLDLAKEGRLVAAIDQVLPIERAGDALNSVKSGLVRGKLVLTTGMD